MPVHQYAQRYAQRRLLKSATRAVPWLGAAIAVATVAATIRRKGLFRGTMDTALTAIPVVGALKIAVEAVRGRDLFPDRPHRRRGSFSPLSRPPAINHG